MRLRLTTSRRFLGQVPVGSPETYEAAYGRTQHRPMILMSSATLQTMIALIASSSTEASLVLPAIARAAVAR